MTRLEKFLNDQQFDGKVIITINSYHGKKPHFDVLLQISNVDLARGIAPTIEKAIRQCLEEVPLNYLKNVNEQLTELNHRIQEYELNLVQAKRGRLKILKKIRETK